jgi:hypothetical protein
MVSTLAALSGQDCAGRKYAIRADTNRPESFAALIGACQCAKVTTAAHSARALLRVLRLGLQGR